MNNSYKPPALILNFTIRTIATIRIWSDVTGFRKHAQFSAFVHPQNPQGLLYRFEIFRDNKGIVVLQSLRVSHLSNIPNRFNESPKFNLKNWKCELANIYPVINHRGVHNSEFWLTWFWNLLESWQDSWIHFCDSCLQNKGFCFMLFIICKRKIWNYVWFLIQESRFDLLIPTVNPRAVEVIWNIIVSDPSLIMQYNDHKSVILFTNSSNHCGYVHIILINAHLSVILSIDVAHELTHTVTMIIWRSERVLLYTPAGRKDDKICHSHPRFCGRTCEHSKYWGILWNIIVTQSNTGFLDLRHDQRRLRWSPWTYAGHTCMGSSCHAKQPHQTVNDTTKITS